MATSKGDILLNSQPYLLVTGGYSVAESFRARPAPASQPRSLSVFEHQNNWVYFGQSAFAGMGFDEFGERGPFLSGYGLDLNALGEISVAKELVNDVADTLNTGGYVGFRIGFTDGTPTKVIFGGRTNGTSFSKNTSTGVWTTTTNALGVGVSFRSHGFFNETTHVGASNGNLFITSDGITYTSKGKGSTAPATSANILGVVKGRIYVGYSDKSIWAMDTGGVWTEFVAPGILTDQPAVTGAAGSNGLFIVTAGPQPRVYFTDGSGLVQLTVIGTDISPKAAVFLNQLYIFGCRSFASTPKGVVWALSNEGLEEIFSFGDGLSDQCIYSAQVEGDVILWGANNVLSRSGIGVFDPRLDVLEHDVLGFYVNSTITGNLVVQGLAEAEGVRYCGIRGGGVYKQGTPGPYRVKSGLFGGDSRNIQKFWGQAEARHTALVLGQTVTVITSKNPTDAGDTWGTNSTVGATSSIISAPVDYRTPFLSYVLQGNANGSALTIYDIALAYIRMADTSQVKREWRLRIAVEGRTGALQVMRDKVDNTRTGMQMFTDLNALWNTRTTFEDIDGTTYTVVVKAPSSHPAAGSPGSGELDRRVTAGVVDNLSLVYELHLVQL